MSECYQCGLEFPRDELKEESMGMACEDCHANCDHDSVECGYCNDCMEHIDWVSRTFVDND